MPGNGREIEITEELFLHDALILSGLRSRCVTLESRRKGRVVTVMLGGAPYLGLWAKPGAPFVCIEHGMAWQTPAGRLWILRRSRASNG